MLKGCSCVHKDTEVELTADCRLAPAPHSWRQSSADHGEAHTSRWFVFSFFWQLLALLSARWADMWVGINHLTIFKSCEIDDTLPDQNSNFCWNLQLEGSWQYHNAKTLVRKLMLKSKTNFKEKPLITYDKTHLQEKPRLGNDGRPLLNKPNLDLCKKRLAPIWKQIKLSRMLITYCKQRIWGRSIYNMLFHKKNDGHYFFLKTLDDNSSSPQVVSWEIRRAPLLPQLERVLDQVWGLGLVQCQELLQVMLFQEMIALGLGCTTGCGFYISQSQHENCMLLSATTSYVTEAEAKSMK